MNNLREALVSLWENLAGIQIDEKSKILRIIFFSVLLIGSVWAVINYINSENLSNLESDSYVTPPRSRVDVNINKLIERVNSLNRMRSNSDMIAISMTAMNRRLFNTDSEIMNGLDTSDINLAENGSIALPELSMTQEITPPEIQVKAVMTSGKNRLAVINTPGNTALIVKRGSKLPGDLGQITAISKKSITVRFAKHNFIYSIGEQGATDTTSNNNNSSRKSLRENIQAQYDIQDLYRTAK